jgi:hypothetical protein
MKQIGIAVTVLTVLAGAGASATAGVQSWLIPELQNLHWLTKAPATSVMPAVQPRSTQSLPTQTVPNLLDPSVLRVPGTSNTPIAPLAPAR